MENIEKEMPPELESVLEQMHDWIDKNIPQFCNKKREPISEEEWIGLMREVPYKRIARTVTDDLTISTVWLGFPHSPYDPDLGGCTFETMVFKNDNIEMGAWLEEFTERYWTEEEAIEGHKKICEQITLNEEAYAEDTKRHVKE